ncbi:MAG: hypothetical protein NZ805_04995 [Armatimonadetes bacterium]|nr:hypothetical protein [Armatimonadota bacterium]MDW8028809.1 hypothetical protein [Armatimonadota bacterium]
MNNKEVPCVIGLRKEEAAETLIAIGFEVRFKETKPPKPKASFEPIGWRVIAQKASGNIVELTVTPEWIDWLPIRSSENSGT